MSNGLVVNLQGKLIPLYKIIIIIIIITISFMQSIYTYIP